MKKSELNILIILILISIVFSINSFYYKFLTIFGVCVILFLFLVLVKFMIGFNKEKNRFSKDVLLSVIIYLLVYYIVIYLFGLIFGFNKTIYDLSFVGIIKNIFPNVLIIILSEFIRYIVNSKFKDDLIVIIFSTITFVLIDTTFIFTSIDYNSVESIVKNFGLFIIPSITTNIMLSNFAYNFGYRVNIIYRLLMEIPIYLVSIVPSFGNYLDSVIFSCIPLLILYLVNVTYNNQKKVISKNKVKNMKIINFIYLIVMIIMISLVCLTSGLFKYRTIVIASGSMEPVIYRGDVSVVKKLNYIEINQLKEGDILVFNMDNKIVIHRIYSIIISGDEVFYKTKGDNNNDVDNFLVERSDIIGISVGLFKYIGYPSLWLSEML